MPPAQFPHRLLNGLAPVAIAIAIAAMALADAPALAAGPTPPSAPRARAEEIATEARTILAANWAALPGALEETSALILAALDQP